MTALFLLWFLQFFKSDPLSAVHSMAVSAVLFIHGDGIVSSSRGDAISEEKVDELTQLSTLLVDLVANAMAVKTHSNKFV